MKVLQKIFARYISWHIHVSLAVIAFSAITVLQFNLVVPDFLWVLIFGGSLIGYNFITHPSIFISFTDSISKNIWLQIVFCFTALFALLFFLLRTSWVVTATSFFLGILTLLYAVPFLNNRNLRSLAGLKFFLVALVWSGVTVLIPLEFADRSLLSLDVAVSFFQRFIIVLLLMIPFEIRDFHYDVPQLVTIPQKYGIRKTKLFGLIGSLLVFGLEFLKIYSIRSLLSLSIFLLLLIGSIFISSENQQRYFSSFWVESLPIVWLLLQVLLAN